MFCIIIQEATIISTRFESRVVIIFALDIEFNMKDIYNNLIKTFRDTLDYTVYSVLYYPIQSFERVVIKCLVINLINVTCHYLREARYVSAPVSNLIIKCQ